MNKKLRFTLIFVITITVIGCGTINTVLHDDSVPRRNLSQVKSPCETIPRIYSGVSYNICALRGKPSKTTLWAGAVPELVLVDIVLSGMLDTVALPYTIYEQIIEGDIELRKNPY